MRDVEKTIGNIIDHQSTCYISSVDEDGYPNTKAMFQPRKRNGIYQFYFTTNTSSQKVKSFRKNEKACLYFCDKRFYRGVMLKGKIEVLENQEIKDMIWQDKDILYYKEGKTDPDYCVLCFTTTSLRYYSGLKSEDIDIIKKDGLPHM